MSSAEMLVSLLIFATVVLGASAAATTARRVLDGSQRDTEYWATVQMQTERLLTLGYDNVSSGDNGGWASCSQGGADTTAYCSQAPASGVRYPMRWEVTGTDPKQVLIVSERPDGFGHTVADTVIMLFARP